MKGIAIVIPAYNEESRISSVVRDCKKVTRNVIVVNDGSIDDTENKALDAGATVISHIVNLGLGATLQTGSDFALKKGFNIIIHFDGDGQHYASDLPQAINLLKKNNLDIVFGSRFLTDNKRPIVKLIGNYFLNFVCKILWNIDVTDSQSGFRVMKSSAWNKMRVGSPGYEVSSRIVCQVGKKGLKYSEVPIKSIYTDKFKGTTVLDGIRIFFKMLCWKVVS